MTKYRELAIGLAVSAATIVLCLVTAEIALRFLPVSSGMRTMPVTAAQPVFHFLPNRDYVYSNGWALSMANRGHVNNVGYVNDQDYHKSSLPMIGVIGNSYVEALMIPYPATFHGLLAKALDGKARVYSFAASGAALSQYLIWARYATHEQGAQYLIFAVFGADFDRSHAAYKDDPGFWYYFPDAQDRLTLRLVEYRPNPLREIVFASALARYLVFNLRLGAQWWTLKNFLFPPAAAAPRFTGNVENDISPRHLHDANAALDAFLRDLPTYSGLPPDHILFIMDGSRYVEAAAAAKGSYFDLMRTAFLKKTAALGYATLDVNPAFFASYRCHPQKFEFPNDGHWNIAGHRVVFDAIMASHFLDRLKETAVRPASGC